MFKIALIGSGFIGTVHASAYRNLPNAQLVAVADINEAAGRKLAEEFSCRYYQNAEAMLRQEQPDVADICLPTFLHEPYVALSAKYCRHVLCEKPFGLSLDSCKRMVQCCEDAGATLMVAQAARWTPEFVDAARLLREDTFGRLHMVSTKRLSQAPAWTTWHQDPKKSGGGLYDLHVHNLDWLISVFGEVERVSAVGWKSDTGCWNHVAVSLTFRSGVNAVDESSLDMVGDYPFSYGLRIVGDKATYDFSYIGGQNIENCDTAVNAAFLYPKAQQPRKAEAEPGDLYELELRDYLAALEAGQPVPIAPAQSLYVMQVVEAVQQALETGETVKL